MADVQYQPVGTKAAPNDWTLPSSAEFTLKCARASFDGSAAAGAWLPALEILSAAGTRVGLYITATTVAAGASADVSFFPLARQQGVTGPAPGASLTQTLIAAGFDVIYKLDETTGTIAHDSSGNGFDAPTPGGRSTASWNNPAGPPGTTTAHFDRSGTPTEFRNTTYPALAADWTILAWFNRDDNNEQWIFSQGAPAAVGNNGLALRVEAFNQGLGNRACINVGSGGALYVAESDAAIVTGDWNMVAATRAGTLVTLYVQGVAQLSTGNPAYGSTTGTHLGQSGGTFGALGFGSFFAMKPAALTAAQIAAIFVAGTL